MELTLNNLAYALSYKEFAKMYQQGSYVLTLDNINNSLLNNIRVSIKNKVNKNKVNEFINVIRKEIKY